MALSQVKALLRARPGNGIPSISPMRAQARRRFAQVIHMVVHSKAGNTFSCPAGRQQRASVPVLARGGRHAGRGSGLGLVDIVRDGGRWSSRTGGPRTQAPACCHAHRDPAGCASSIRSSCPGSVAAGAGPPPALPRPGAGALGAGPPRRPGSAGDHRPATADAGALAPEASRCLPVLWPARADGKPVGSTTGTRPGSWPQDPRSPHAAWPGPESLPHRALRDLRPVRSRICGRPIRPIRPGRRCSRDAAPSLAGQRSDRPARVCCRRGGSRAHGPPAAAARGLVGAVS